MRTFRTLDVINMYYKKGYPLKEGIMEMNIFGIRNSDADSNTFDDVVGVVYKDIDKTWKIKQYTATTDPGEYYRENPLNSDGTAIIIPAYHKDCYKIGVHKGYEAMEQIGPMLYVRDNNKNKTLDFLYKVTGFKVFKQIGKTNIHHAGSDSKLVDKWSAGCQVFAKLKEFLEFMKIIKSSLAYGKPNLFSYALFEIQDFG